jgi:hypothetical protein
MKQTVILAALLASTFAPPADAAVNGFILLFSVKQINPDVVTKARAVYSTVNNEPARKFKLEVDTWDAFNGGADPESIDTGNNLILPNSEGFLPEGPANTVIESSVPINGTFYLGAAALKTGTLNNNGQMVWTALDGRVLGLFVR